jgi:hypothetical protein
MDLAKVVAELKQELANLDAAIVSLERLQAAGRRRGTSKPDGKADRAYDKDDT